MDLIIGQSAPLCACVYAPLTGLVEEGPLAFQNSNP